MVLAQKPQVKGNITFHPIFTQDPVQFLQPFNRLKGTFIAHKLLSPLQRLRRTEKIVYFQKNFTIIPAYGFPLQQLLGTEKVFAGNVIPEFVFCFLIQPRLGADPFKILHLPDAHLEVLQAGGFQRFHHKCDHFSVRFHGRLLNQLGPQLGDLLQLSLKIGGIRKCIPQIRKTDRKSLIHKIFGGASSHGRREIRPEDKRITLFVKKLIQLP